MKNRIIILMALVVLLLQGCKKDEVPQTDADLGETCRIEVLLPGSDSSLPPSQPAWTSSDQLSVVIRDGAKTSVHKFRKAEGDDNGFETNTFVPEAGKSYEYYVIFPYDSRISGMDDEGYYTTPMALPVVVDGSVPQQGVGNTDHLSGVLYGCSEEAKDDVPQVQLHPLMGVLAVSVKNESSVALNVTSLAFTNDAEVSLCGSFYVNGADGSLKSPGSAYVSDESVLDISGGTVAPGAEGLFYMPAPSFSIPEGKTLSVTLTADEVTVRQDVTGPVDLSAGASHTIDITVTQAYVAAGDVESTMRKLYDGMLIEDFGFCSENNPNARLEYFTGYAVARQKEDDFANSGRYINGLMGGEWIRYDLIRSVNDFLASLEGMTGLFPSEQLARMKSEARVIRAWYYYTMAVRYGGMPLITEENNAKTDVARSTEKQIWDFIISEVDAAVEGGLPEKADSEGRFDKYSALALKARAAIHAAGVAKYSSGVPGIDAENGPCGIAEMEANNYYSQALSAASEIIMSGKFALARELADNPSDSYARLFLEPDRHRETILVKGNGTSANSHGWDYYHLPDPLFDRVLGEPRYDNPTLQLVNMYDLLDGSSAAIDLNLDWSPEQPTVDGWFVGRDYRLAGTIYYPGCPFPVEGGKLTLWRGLIGSSGDVWIEPGWLTINGTLYYARGTYGMGDDTDTPTGFLCRKYVDESNFSAVSPNSSIQKWIAIRYAEILLIAAEAAAESGNDPGNVGLSSINDIRDRAGLPALPALTVSEVRKQWICEMAFENRIFWCMRRWRTLNESLSDYMPRGLAPYYGPEWTNASEVWKFRAIDASKYRRNSFNPIYYYNQISSDELASNQSMTQNYGY